MTLPLSKPQVGGTGWHTNYWQMVDLWNSIDERIRDLIGATVVAGVGLEMVVNDAGDTVTLNNTSLSDAEAIQDMFSTFLVEGDNVTLTYDDTGNTLTISAAGGGSAPGRVLQVGPSAYDATVPTGTADSGYAIIEKGNPSDSSNDTAQDASLLWRSGGHTKGEMGLPGDNDLHIKVVTGATESSLTFTDCIICKNATGYVWVPTKLGVGTVPAEKFHIAENVAALLAKIENTSSSGGASAGIQLAGAGKTWAIKTDVGANRGDNMAILSGTTGYPPEIMLTPGKVGIDNDAPVTALDVAGSMTLRNVTAPATPTSAAVIYSESGVLKTKDTAGVVTPLAYDDSSARGASQRIVALTDGATITPNSGTTDVGTVTIAGNRTIANPSGTPTGARKLILRIKQDGTGSRTVTWGSAYRFSGGTPPTLTTAANKTDYIGFIYNVVDAVWDCVAFKGNF